MYKLSEFLEDITNIVGDQKMSRTTRVFWIGQYRSYASGASLEEVHPYTDALMSGYSTFERGWEDEPKKY